MTWYSAALSLVSLAAGLGQAGPTSLVRNSDFERAFVPDGAADGWRAGRLAPGVEISVARGRGVDGGAAQLIAAGPDADVTWYACSQTLSGALPGGQYVLSAFVRTDDVRDGAGAYLGANYYAPTGQRISFTDSDVKLTGTTDWTRIAQRFTVPRDAERVEMCLVLHGHGSAVFDRAQVVAGTEPADWQSEGPEADVTDRGSSVAILSDDLPATGTPSDPAYLRELAEAAGYDCAFLTADEVADSEALRYSRFDVLVLPYGSSFPAPAADALKAFLREGGSLISVGGYPLDRLLVRQDGRWLDATDIEPDPATLTPLADLSDVHAGWQTGGREVPVGPAPTAPGRDGECLKLATDALRGWVTLTSPQTTELPADSLLTAFYARADRDGTWVTFEWVERDGARWRQKLKLSTEWKLYAVPYARLEYWKDNPSKGRGGPDDRFHPENASYVSFGLTEEFLRGGERYAAYVEGIHSSDIPFPQYASLHLNSRYGGINPATFLEPPLDAISICDASADMTDVATMVAEPLQSVAPAGLRIDGPVSGCSATGQTAQGSAGAPLKARWEPLLNAVDRYGRVRGTAFAIMHNFAGEYPGSSWAYSGVSDRDLFARGSVEGVALFRSVLDRVTDGAFVFDARTQYAAARPGEELAPAVRVANLARRERLLTVRLTLLRDGQESGHAEKIVSVGPRTSASVALDATALSTGSPALVVMRWQALDGERVLDLLESGVVVVPEHPAGGGPALRYSDCYFDRGSGPEFLVGSQLYWGNATTTGTDPLRWDRQLARMADSGLSIARSFMNVPGGDTEQAWRYRDAIVALAAAHGVHLFYSGVSWPTTDPVEVARRAEVARTAAERYADYPGWFLDVVNEPSMRIGEGAADSAQFREYLLRRYGSYDALREAWGYELAEASLDEVKIGPMPGPWGSLRAIDTHRFMSGRMRDWARATMDAAHSVGPRLVSVGYLQGFGDTATTWDPVEASRDLDFANRHYYGPIENYGPELAQVDMRTVGKAPTTGEFGATSHPGLEAHFVYETEDKAASRFSYFLHTCFGLGGAFAASWHWQDPIEDIFPCGLLFADGAARPRFYPYRDVAMLFQAIRPVYEPPEVFFVIPSSHRFGAPVDRVNDAMMRSLRSLVALHVEFGTVSEDTLHTLPASARVLVWPVPYCPSDETYERVREFVRRGGLVYVSGDLSYDERRHRTKTARLEELCGVRFVKERYPDIQYAASDGAVLPATDSALAHACAESDLRGPCIEVEPTTAATLATAGGAPVAVLNALGQGRVLYFVDPLELHGDPWRVLAAFLDQEGVGRHRLTPDVPEVHSHRVRGQDGALAQLLLNTSDADMTVTVTDLPEPVTIDLAPHSGGAVIFGPAGQVVGAEGRAVTVAGTKLFSADGTIALRSLRGDLRGSRRTLLLPMGSPGRVAVPSATGPEASFGEVVDGRWKEYQRVPFAGALELDSAQARSWAVLGERGAVVDPGTR